MSAFKDAIAADIKAVFLNGLEFADEHNINGNTVLCVVDDDIIDEHASRSSPDYVDGVFTNQKMIYAAESDFSNPPVRGELLRLDGERFMVVKVARNMGVLEITIEANDQ